MVESQENKKAVVITFKDEKGEERKYWMDYEAYKKEEELLEEMRKRMRLNIYKNER